MKKVFFFVLASVLIIGAGSAFANGMSIDLMGDYGSGLGDYDSGFGLGVGVNADYGKIIHVAKGTKLAKISKNMQFRADLSYFKWDHTAFDVIKLKYTRVPIFVGLRYLFPLSNGFNAFLEGGPEISFDKYEVAVQYPSWRAGHITYEWKTDQTSSMRFGGGVGAGIQYNFANRFYGGIHARYNAITDWYYRIGLYAGIRF